jgi:hypothetical protein
MEHKCYLTSD